MAINSNPVLQEQSTEQILEISDPQLRHDPVLEIIPGLQAFLEKEVVEEEQVQDKETAAVEESAEPAPETMANGELIQPVVAEGSAEGQVAETGMSAGDDVVAGNPDWLVLGGAVLFGGAAIALANNGSSSSSATDTAGPLTALRPSYNEIDDGEVTYAFKVERPVADIDTAATYDWAVTGSGTNPADADDFGGTLPSGTVKFSEGELWQVISFTVSGDTDLEPDETFTVTLTDAAGSTTATGTIFNNEANPLALTIDVTDGSSIVSETGGDGDDAISVTYATSTGINSWDLYLDGGAGNDIISVDLTGSSMNGDTFNIQGGDGNDTIGFNFDWTAENAYTNDITINGGGGYDAIGVVFDLRAVADGTDFDFDNNTINLLGGTGDDLISLEYYKTDVIDTAGADNNVINLLGEAGNDTLIVDWNEGYQSTETIYSNDWLLDGGTGNDSLHFEYWLQENIYSTMYSNSITLLGGEGDDALSIDLTFTDMLSTFISNTISMQGGDGDDSLVFNMSLATVSTSGYVASNVYDISGGAGNDVINFNYTGTGSNYVWSEEINISGGDGIDLISVNFDVSAPWQTNVISIDGGAGADAINIAIGTSNTLASIEYNTTGDLGDSISGLTTGNNFEFHFDATVFNGSTSAGVLVDTQFVSGADAVALDADDYWIYDTTGFELYYDADGSGAGAAQLVASFDVNIDLAATQIYLDSPIPT